MKVHFIGVARRYGTSAKTGKQYDMCMLSYAVAIRPNVTQTMNYSGFGYEGRCFLNRCSLNGTN